MDGFKPEACRASWQKLEDYRLKAVEVLGPLVPALDDNEVMLAAKIAGDAAKYQVNRYALCICFSRKNIENVVKGQDVRKKALTIWATVERNNIQNFFPDAIHERIATLRKIDAPAPSDLPATPAAAASSAPKRAATAMPKAGVKRARAASAAQSEMD